MAAEDIPTPRSHPSILGEMIDAFTSRYALKKIRKGGAILSILEASAQSDVRSTQDIFTLLNTKNLNRSKGLALQRTAADEDIKLRPAISSSGKVTITDTSFNKVSTRIYPGAAAPNAGSFKINVADASSFPASGSIYLGRGTTNYEGPLPYTAAPDGSPGSYWIITVTAATQKFHNVNESVVLAQGGARSIASGLIVSTPQSALSSAVNYATTTAATIEDGEISVENIAITCQTPGPTGNASATSINVISSAPFAGAAVSNPLPLSNGLPVETEDELRDRIRNARQSRAKGTRLAITSGTIGITAHDENKIIVSSTMIALKGEPATLFIDDGTGYEEQTAGIAQETFIDQAVGGESYFRVSSALPISKAFTTTTLTAPFALVAGASLSIRCGGVLSEHSFNEAEFKAIANATAYEIVAAINGDPSLGFSARTADSASRVTVFARTDTNEDIEVLTPDTGIDANAYLGFSTGLNLSLHLYKNDTLLYKDGLIASVVSAPTATWSNTIASGVQLQIAVDGTPAVVYTFTDADFVAAGTGFTTAAAANGVQAWATVFNAKVPGITATVAGGRIVLTSNVGAAARAQIVVSEPTGVSNNLIQKGMFTAAFGLVGAGAANDYTLDRNTGEGKLSIPLALGDSLTGGTVATRAYIQGAALSTATTTVGSPGGTIWVTTDGEAAILSTGISAATPFTVATSGTAVRYTATSGSNIFGVGSTPYIKVGDWVIIWSTSFTALGSWRISAVDPSYLWFEVNRPKTGDTGAAVSVGDQIGVISSSGGMVFVRSGAPLQSIRIAAGTNRTLSSIVDEINGQLVGAKASIYRNIHIRIATNTFDGGDVMVVAADTAGQSLGLSLRALDSNSASHLAAIAAGNDDVGTPNFDLGVVGSNKASASGGFAQAGASITTGDLLYWIRRAGTTSQGAFGRTVDLYSPIISIASDDNDSTADDVDDVVTPRLNVNTYATAASGTTLIRDGVGNVTVNMAVATDFRVGDIVYLAAVTSADSNFLAGYKLVVSTPSTTVFTYYENVNVGTSTTTSYTVNRDQGVLGGDIVAPVSPLAIGPDDSLSVVVDGDINSKDFIIPLGRRIKPAGGAIYSQSAFGVVDVDNSDATPATAFGSSDANLFRDFAVFMHARVKSHSNADGWNDNKAIIWRYTRLGPEGNKARIAYVNPTGPSQAMSLTTVNGLYADLQITLPSGTAEDAGVTDTTRFNVSVSGTDATYACAIATVAIAGASRAGDKTTVTVSTVAAHGFSAGDVVYVTSADILYASGSKVLVSASGTTLVYLEYNATPGSSTVAFTISGAATSPNFNTNILPNDIVTIGTGSGFNVANTGTFRVLSIAVDGLSFIVRRSTGAVAESHVSVKGAGNMVFYRISAATTANTVVGWVNANIADVVTAIAVNNSGGSPGTGIINKATADEDLDRQNGTAGAEFNSSISPGSVQAWSFTDGINFVLASDLSASPNTISLKNSVNSGLINDSDFAAEDMRLAPITTAALVRYVSNPGVSGIYASSEIVGSKNGKYLQLTSSTIGALGLVQVTGGTGNSVSASVLGTGSVVASSYSLVTIDAAQAQGLIGGRNVAVQAGNTMPKVSAWIATGGSLAFATDGTVTAGANTWVLRQQQNDAADMWKIDKVGNFAVYTLIDGGSSNALDASIIEGDWVDINLAGASASNVGIKQVVRVIAGQSFWVENDEAVSETVRVVTNDSLRFYSYDSIMPGDIFVVDTDTFGAANHGSFTVLGHGSAATQFVISGSHTVKTTTSMSTDASFIRVVEKAPARLIKKIHTIARNNVNSAYLDVVFTTSALASKMSATAQSVIEALDKLDFDSSIVGGADAYSYSTGLIGEATKVLYGDAANPDVYPGIVAVGANVNVSGPLIKRISVSLAIRINKGGVKEDIINRVKSAVAAAINAVPHGTSVDISNYVGAARAIAGVAAVTPISPALTTGKDLIPVQANEKPRVLDIDEDITVSIIGSQS